MCQLNQDSQTHQVTAADSCIMEDLLGRAINSVSDSGPNCENPAHLEELSACLKQRVYESGLIKHGYYFKLLNSAHELQIEDQFKGFEEDRVVWILQQQTCHSSHWP